MKKSLTFVATLALAAVLIPAAFAQQDQSAQPSSSAPAAAQPQAAPDQGAAAQPQGSSSQVSGDQGAASPSSAAPVQSQSPSAAPQGSAAPSSDNSAAAGQTSFSGTVVKVGKHYVLKTDTITYQLDDQTKARQFEGKQVTVNGTLDKSTSMIRVTDIQPAS